MFPYSPSSNPALRSHVDSQLAWFNDLNKTLTGSFQAVCQTNLKLGQTMIEETIHASQRMLSSERPFDALGAAASHAQPATDKLRAYQQHLSRLAAEVQVELARVTQQHSPEAARTAHALADEVTRAATEETARSMQQQEEVLKTFRDPFQPVDAQRGNGHAPDSPAVQADRASASTGSGASMQFDGLADNGSVQGHVQGPSLQAAQQAGNKSPRKPS
ncbi:phasin family protein [Massilia sp. BSC265]|uniref:phasin family protein n=1 Tax=Massilia sp. BSC265 TaxID=1549812 RepID=UPI00056CEFFE|nr:phasin family protein [Massilia sp. BSC265]